MSDINIYLALPHNAASETFLTPENLEALASLGTLTRQSGTEPLSEEELCTAVVDMDIVVTTWGQKPFSETVLQHANRLKFVAHTAGTVAPFCTDELFARGIRVVSGNDVFAESVAEAVLTYILASLRDVPRYDRIMKAGGWRGELDNQGLFGRTVGLVGFGAIPRFLLPMLKPFGCKVLAYDPFAEEEIFRELGVQRADLTTIFTEADIVSVHLPLKHDTMGMINANYLKRMKEGALLVNTARGAVIDETALIEVLQSGRIKAVLDVFAKEPLDVDSPLRRLENAILIPHMGGPTLDRRKDAARIVIEDIARFLNGEALRHEIRAEKAANMTR